MEIICSIIPETHSFQNLIDFYNCGMTSVRFNFSHADYDKTHAYIEFVRKCMPKVRIIQDLQGSKFRVSNLLYGEIRVNKYQSVYFCSEKSYLSNKTFNCSKVLIPISNLVDFSKIYGAKKIIMKDATMEFRLLRQVCNDEIIEATVIRGGIIRGEKGINILGANVHSSELTDKDKKDIEFGLISGVDVISLSFTSSSKDLLCLKKFIKNFIKHSEATIKMPMICAKIETKEGIDNIQSILRNADIIMLGRGDFYSEIDILEVAALQEQIINFMKKSKKEFIIATYLLESMKNNEIPSISEISALYNFLKSGVKSFMLVGEVTLSNNPVSIIRFLKSFYDNFKNPGSVQDIDCQSEDLEAEVINAYDMEQISYDDDVNIEIELGELIKDH